MDTKNRLWARGPICTMAIVLMLGGSAFDAASEPQEPILKNLDEVAEIVRPKNFIPQGAESGTELFPPNARPGGCYARVLVPAKFINEEVTTIKSESSERLVTIPAKYETVTESVLAKEASEKIEVIPATYEWVKKTMLIQEASERIEVIPAVYETVTEQVIDKPAHTIWEKGRGLVEKVNFTTGEIICLKEIPATYKTISKRILKTPATTKVVTIPAKYRTISQQVMKTPPTTRTITIPAQFKMQKVVKLIEPAKVNRVLIPEEKQTFWKAVKISEEKMAWKPVLCQTNVTPEIVRNIQISLKENGFYPGPLDGEIGPITTRGILRFQQENGLSRGGLTAETIKALKVDLPWSAEFASLN
jgi:hypothetical protein